jgi:hypothetical protein
MKKSIPENKIQIGNLTIRLPFLIYSCPIFSLDNKTKKPLEVLLK